MTKVQKQEMKKQSNSKENQFSLRNQKALNRNFFFTLKNRTQNLKSGNKRAKMNTSRNNF